MAVTGKGTLDGQADAEHWWPWKRNGHPQSQKPDRDRLFAQAEAGVPVAERVYGAGHYLRPQFVQPYRCTNVLIEGVTITNAPMWVIHPVLSRNVTVRGVTVVSRGAEQRRLRPGVLDRRPDRGRPLRHRRRLHRDQVGPQRRRPAARRPVRADRRARLPHAGRPRRGDDRQRGERERPRRLRREERDEQPRPRAGDPLQDERDARGDDRERLRARRRDRRGGLGDRHRHALRGGGLRPLHAGGAQRAGRPHDRRAGRGTPSSSGGSRPRRSRA